jgi:hypothetical protein
MESQEKGREDEKEGRRDGRPQKGDVWRGRGCPFPLEKKGIEIRKHCNIEMLLTIS